MTYSEAAELAYNGAKVLHPRTLAPLIERRSPSGARTASRRRSRERASCLSIGAGNPGARAVTSMANVALVSLEPASPGCGRRAHDGARARCARPGQCGGVGISSSSYRQSFCFLVRTEELAKTATQAIESALALELAHGLRAGDRGGWNVGLLAVVGEGMQGKLGRRRPHLHGDFPREREYHRHRAGVERIDDLDRGRPRRAGEGRARGACGVRHGDVKRAGSTYHWRVSHRDSPPLA
jgi:aspartokinase